MVKKLSKLIVCSIVAIMILACVPLFSACKDKTYSVEFKVASSINSFGELTVFYKTADTIEVEDGECIGNSAPNATYAGGHTYEFAGWYTEKELINKWDIYKDEVRSDMTLYAKYIKK